MSNMFIRVKKCGTIYSYDEILAKNPLCEVIPEEIAFPERFIPEHAKKRKGKAKLDLTTDEVPEPPEYTSPELAEEASRGLPK
jgi:hypothetical protein